MLAWSEVEVLVHAHIDDGVLAVQLPDNKRHEAHDSQNRQSCDEVGAEPVVLLALIEHDLQCAYAQNQQRNADVIDARGDPRLDLGPWRVVDDAVHQEQRQDAHGKIDEEDPPPGVVVGDPAAECGADGGRDDDRDCVERKGEATLFGREAVGEDRLGKGLKTTATGALQDAEDDDGAEAGGNAAQQGADGEDGKAHHEEALAAQHVGEPSADGEDDGVRDQVRSENPGALVGAGAQVAADVGKRDVGYAGVEDFHEGGARDNNSYQPGIELGLPRCGRGQRWCVGDGRCRLCAFRTWGIFCHELEG